MKFSVIVQGPSPVLPSVGGEPRPHGLFFIPLRLIAGLFILLFVTIGGGGCQSGQSATSPTNESSIQGSITVFAAASLTEPYQEIGEQFETIYPGTSVSFNFANSQQLAYQLAQGAPADVFASANTRQMDVAIESGRVVSGTQQVFAHNRLVAIVSNRSQVSVTRLADLANPALTIVLATEEAPIGNYSRQFLDKAAADASLGPAYSEAVLANVVSYEQTVKAVLTKVVLGEGDAGIVYASDVTAKAANHLTTIPIPNALNTIAPYPIALVSDSANPQVAQAFISFVRSPEGQSILETHGLIAPGQRSGQR
jgi:molybdate transport system substrate-binding protein